MLGDPTTSWRLADRQILGNAAHRAGGLDPSLTLRVGMSKTNQSTLPITTRRVSEGWLWLKPISPHSITTRRVSEGRRSLYGPTGRADTDIPD
jgi:hypothetical protein